MTTPVAGLAGAGRQGSSPLRRSALVLVLAFGAYLALSVLLWWHVWSTHPTSVTTCGCGDPALFTWFLEWPAYALAHGHNPFYSSALFHPTGIDLLSNTSVLAIGIPLAPVTWLFGPVATLNVASTLTPALSALSMCWLLRRWVNWSPAAFVGGLLYGFSPFVFVSLASAHLMTAALVVPPLVVACLDDLLVRRRHAPVAIGAVLGLLVAVQFFVGTEVLAMMVLMGVVGAVLAVAYAAVFARQELASAAPRALMGLGAAVVVAAAALAYPAWFALRGPAHLSGLVWPTIHPGLGGVPASTIWHVTYAPTAAARIFSGYQGPPLPDAEYLGPGLLAAAAAGLVAWRRDRRLWLFAGLGVVGVVLCLGRRSYWTPWRVLAKVPVLQNAVPSRMAAMVTLCAAVILAVVVDRTHGAGLLAGRRVLAVAAAVVVATVALGPMAAAERSNVPFTTRTVTLPAWFAGTARRLPAGQVVLAFPPPSVGGGALVWQAADRLQFAVATGAGPGSVPSRAGAERAAQELLTDGAALFTGPPAVGRRGVAEVRRALRGWGVTEVAVMAPAAVVRPFGRASATAWALAVFTMALGRTPTLSSGAWVWIGTAGRSLTVPAVSFERCTAPGVYDSRSAMAVPECVVAAARTPS